MEIPWEDGEYVGRNIKYLAPGPQSGHRFRLIKFVNDHRGERRPVKGTWKFSDMLSRKSARARVEARRDEVDQNRKNITWLRKEFPEPKKKPKPKNLLGNRIRPAYIVPGLADLEHGNDLAQMMRLSCPPLLKSKSTQPVSRAASTGREAARRCVTADDAASA